MIIYLHIAKTGGTTMLHWLKRQCKTWHVKSWWSSNWFIPAGTECLFSHCPYGVPDKHIPGAHRYVTFLREPVDRIISNYYHVLNDFTHPQHHDYSRYPLSDLVGAGLFSTFDNGMVRLIAGRSDIGNLPPVGVVTEDDLYRAKVNISSFAAVGFLDQFNKSMVRIANLFGWTDLRYNRYRTGDRPPMSSFRPDILEAIREQNRFDVALVEFAREIGCCEKVSESGTLVPSGEGEEIFT